MQAATLKETYCQNRSDFLALKSMHTYQWAPAKVTMCPEKYLIRALTQLNNDTALPFCNSKKKAQRFASYSN